MELMTRIDIPASEWKIAAGEKVLLVGSCFADEIGEKMVRGGFEAMVNPFGTLYNPASIAASLLRSISEKEYTADSVELIQSESDGMWHSWMHHSSFSSLDVATLVERINGTTHCVADFLREADVLIVTINLFDKIDAGMQNRAFKIPGKQQIAAATDVQHALTTATQFGQHSHQFIDRAIADKSLGLDIQPERVVLT